VVWKPDSAVLQNLWFISRVHKDLQVNKPAEVIRFSHPLESICKAALFISVSLYGRHICCWQASATGDWTFFVALPLYSSLTQCIFVEKDQITETNYCYIIRDNVRWRLVVPQDLCHIFARLQGVTPQMTIFILQSEPEILSQIFLSGSSVGGSRFSEQCCWTIRSYGMWQYIVGWVVADISKDRFAFVFSTKK
jgi:hypothetical protein